jgi:NAD(P)-dependent dehydrogenase (short-subunit alcohol dehydrogenase family)
MGLHGKVVVVTGSGQGIGEVYAKALAADGAAVAVAEINEQQGARVADEIVAAGGTATYVPLDVSDQASADAMAKAVASAYGGIDHLVNNAASFFGMKLEGLMSVDLDYFYKFMSINLYGALHCARACVPAMRGREGAAIVNQSSTASWMNGGYYSMAKAGINSLTVCLAAELGPQGIRVNAIAPGPTGTDALYSVLGEKGAQYSVKAFPIARLGTPDDHVGTLQFLLSDAAPWMTGQIIAVDGGGTIRT